MKSAHLLFAFACLSASAIVSTGCAIDGSNETEGVGTVRMPLRAVSDDGTEYQLRQAEFDISGPQTVTVLSEDYLTQDAAQVVLGVGDYQVELTGTWQMERIVDGMPEAVEATLVSGNPVAFSIQDQGVSAVTFRFEVEGEVVEMGEGVLELRIEVDEIESDPDPDPGTQLWSIAGPGQLPMAAAGAAGDRVAVTSGPATRFAVGESGLLWQSTAQQPGSQAQEIAAGGPDEILTVTNGGQVFIESFSATNGTFFNYVAAAPSNGVPSRPVVTAVPGGGAVYALGNAGNAVLGRVDPTGNQMWMTPGPGAGVARDIEVGSSGRVLALFGASGGGSQASLSAVDLNGSLQSITFFGIGSGTARALREETPSLVLAYVSQGTQALSYQIDPLTGSALGGGNVLAVLPTQVVHIEPSAGDLVAIATQDSFLHVLDAAGTQQYSVSVAGGAIQDVVFLPDSNAVCAVASDGAASLTTCFAN